jgi:hypothetical protein
MLLFSIKAFPIAVAPLAPMLLTDVGREAQDKYLLSSSRRVRLLFSTRAEAIAIAPES